MITKKREKEEEDGERERERGEEDGERDRGAGDYCALWSRA